MPNLLGVDVEKACGEAAEPLVDLSLRFGGAATSQTLLFGLPGQTGCSTASTVA